MNTKRYNFIKRILIITIIALVCIAVFVISFANDKNIPNWNDIYSFFGISSESQGEDYIKFLDVGQGDCALISSNGYNALIDTGTHETSNDLINELDNLGIEKIDVLIITHLHLDHVGGMEEIADEYDIKNMILPDLNAQLEGYVAAKTVRDNVINANGGIYDAVTGMNVNIGDAELTIIGSYPEMEQENNRSIIIAVKLFDYKFLFMADAQSGAEAQLMIDGINLDCDVLKVGHHGSKTSSSKSFLEKATPEYSIISVGKDNMYHHPSNEVLRALKNVNSTVYRTDENGDITFYPSQNELRLKLEKE